MLEAIKSDPYRLFFPVGWLLGLYSPALWILFAYGQIPFPQPHHADVIVGGSFLCFVMGFLMTAIPRFAQGPRAKSWEIWFSLCFLLALLGGAIFYRRFYFLLLVLVGLLFLVVYGLRRFLRRASNPPSTFLFLPISLFLGIWGVGILISSQWWEMPGTWLEFGKKLFYQGMLLGLILGIGSRLIPGIFGHVEIVVQQRNLYEKNVPYLRVLPIGLVVLTLFYFLSYPLEFFLHLQAGRLLRAGVASVLVWRYWHLHRWPKARTPMAYSLWGVAFLLVVGLWVEGLYPEGGRDVAHLLFVGGFGGITLMIASRVILAHGPGKELEGCKFPYYGIVFFIVLAALTRASIHFMPQSALPHYAYAAICWEVAYLLWGLVFLPKIFVVPSPSVSTVDQPRN
ncbi:MAG: NnrS family protein [Planctomycetota bacterium]|nr:MAG: NnrS family protein [Planctomycetota bacterium]